MFVKKKIDSLIKNIKKNTDGTNSIIQNVGKLPTETKKAEQNIITFLEYCNTLFFYDLKQIIWVAPVKHLQFAHLSPSS